MDDFIAHNYSDRIAPWYWLINDTSEEWRAYACNTHVYALLLAKTTELPLSTDLVDRFLSEYVEHPILPMQWGFGDISPSTQVFRWQCRINRDNIDNIKGKVLMHETCHGLYRCGGLGYASNLANDIDIDDVKSLDVMLKRFDIEPDAVNRYIFRNGIQMERLLMEIPERFCAENPDFVREMLKKYL